MTRLLPVVAAIALLFAAVLGLAPAAVAQCSAGTAIGSCPAGLGYEGCCSATQVVTWCETGLQCELNCLDNGGSATPGNSCCEAGFVPGCCDTAVQQCVCALDDYCCTFEWDDLCASEVSAFGCGLCPMACPGAST